MKDSRVLVVGAGSPNADMVSNVLNSAGIKSAWTANVKRPNPFLIFGFDFVYGIYLQTCSRYIVAGKMLGKKTILHFVGSDAYWFARERSFLRHLYWKVVLWMTDAVLYVSPHLEALVGKKGFVVPFPIRTDAFRRGPSPLPAQRDILYYCPSGSANEKIYRLDWIVEYAKNHPEEKISVIGSPAHPANYSIPLPNVEIIPFVDPAGMPLIYARHRMLIRMTTEDGLPRMVHEALLAGLKVIFNEQEVTEVPREREPAEFAAAIARVLDSLGD